VQELYNLGYDDKNLTKEISFHKWVLLLLVTAMHRLTNGVV
jgi:hypothetical protein